MVAAGMIASHVKGRRMVNVRPTVRGGRRVVRRRHPRLVVRNAREIKDFFEDEVNFSNPFGEWGINLENTYKEAWKNFRLKTALPLPTGSHPDGSEFRWTPQGTAAVTKWVEYEDLLTDVRDDKVLEIVRWESLEAPMYFHDMRCLVIYKDETVAKANVPDDLVLFREACDAHEVLLTNCSMDPKVSKAKRVDVRFAEQMTQLDENEMANRMQSLSYWFSGGSVVILGGIIAWIKLSEIARGDFGDRLKIRLADQREAIARRKRVADSKVEAMNRVEDAMDELQNKAEAGDRRALQELAKMDIEDPDADRFLNFSTVNFTPAQQRGEMGQVLAASEEEKEEVRKERRRMFLGREETEEEKEEEEGGSEAGKSFLQGLTSNKRKKKTKLSKSFRMTGRVYFDDVAGIGEAKEKLAEVVDFFTRPELFKKSGSRRPKGVLMTGPPGTGKTLMARAVAGEAGVSYFSCNASEFVEVFVGVGSARVRDLFKQARLQQPAVIFIDELDALGRERDNDPKHQERNQTLNQLLVMMDGMEEQADIVIIGATNRPDILDKALVRPGRFDRSVHVGYPEEEGRIEILKVHLRDRPNVNINYAKIGRLTSGYSGAKLANLVNQAALNCARAGRDAVGQVDFDKMLEIERLGRILEKQPREDRMRRIAYRRAGIALMGTCLEHVDNTQFISIIPRERMPEGYSAMYYNEELMNTMVMKKKNYEDGIKMHLAAYITEEVVYGSNDITIMSLKDLEMARELARQRIYQANLGTHERLRNRSSLFVQPLTDDRPMKAFELTKIPQDIYHAAEDEIADILAKCRAEAKLCIERNRTAIMELAEELLIHKEMTAKQVYAVVMKYANPADVEGLEEPRNSKYDDEEFQDELAPEEES